MPVEIQADNKRLILRNDPVEVEVSMQKFFNSEVDDFCGVIFFDQKVRQAEEADRRREHEGEVTNRFVIIVELWRVKKKNIHDRGLEQTGRERSPDYPVF